MAEAHDPVLQRQKELLLGNMGANARMSIAIAAKPFVEFKRIEIQCPDRPGGNIDLIPESTGDADVRQLVHSEYTLKEASWTRMRVVFTVHNTVVLGLKICAAVDAKVKLFKDEEILGTFPPKEETQEVLTEWVQTPDGFFKRGSYDSKLYFADADQLVHLVVDSKIKIAKQW